MTSSLVGSEMCIRDSPPRAPSSRHKERLYAGQLRDLCQNLFHQRCSIPVSYTHLTLPTICSV
eukprot:1135603-Prorocentrum_lima.AAC.1